jgi:hypothetical protein
MELDPKTIAFVNEQTRQYQEAMDYIHQMAGIPPERIGKPAPRNDPKHPSNSLTTRTVFAPRIHELAKIIQSR